MEDKQLPLHRWPSYTRKIPFGKVKSGYKVNPDDPLELIPDPDQIIHIEQAFNYLDAGSSLREVSEWLGQKLSRSMVHMTISNLYKRHRRPYLGGQKTKKNVGKKLTKEEKLLRSKQMAVHAAAKTVERRKKELEAHKGKLKPEDWDQPPRGSSKLDSEPKERPAASTPVSSLPSLSPELKFAFTPNPGPQTEFLSSNESEVLYGGAAGGEPKSWFSASFLSNESK